MRAIILIFILVISIDLNSQVANSETEKKTDTTNCDSSKTANQKKANLDTIGKLELIKFSIKHNNEKYEIESVEVYIYKGLLKRCMVYTIDGPIFETYKPFGLSKYDKRAQFIPLKKITEHKRSKGFGYYEKNKTKDSKLSDFLIYIANAENSSFSPSDTTLSLNASKNEKFLCRSTDLNSFVRVHVYSDLLGLLGEADNGLVQTQVNSNIVFNTSPIKTSKRSLFYLFNYVEPSFVLSKFDSKAAFQTIPESDINYNPDSTINSIKVDRVRFNQIAYVYLSLKVNLLKLESYKHTFDLLSVGATLNYSDVYIQSIDEKQTYNGIGWFLETKGQLLEYKNFGYEYEIRSYWQEIRSSKVENNQISFFLTLNNSLFYYPKGKKNNTIFVRLIDVLNYAEKGSYHLLQFGYRTKINLN